MGKKRKNILKTLVTDNQVEKLYIPSIPEKLFKIWWDEIHNKDGSIEWTFVLLQFILFVLIITLVIMLVQADWLHIINK